MPFIYTGTISHFCLSIIITDIHQGCQGNYLKILGLVKKFLFMHIFKPDNGIFARFFAKNLLKSPLYSPIYSRKKRPKLRVCGACPEIGGFCRVRDAQSSGLSCRT